MAKRIIMTATAAINVKLILACLTNKMSIKVVIVKEKTSHVSLE